MYCLIAFEDVGIEFGEKLVVQRGNGARKFAPCNHEAHVQQRGALGDHPDVDAIQGAEHAPGHPRREPIVPTTRQTIAPFCSTLTSGDCRRSARMHSRFLELSMVSDTLTSEVETMSTRSEE